MPCTDTAVLVQFRSISVAVASAPATTVEGSKVKLVTWTVPVQATGSAADPVLAHAGAPPITTDVVAAAVRSTPTSLRICDSSSTMLWRRGTAVPVSWVGGHPLAMSDVD